MTTIDNAMSDSSPQPTAAFDFDHPPRDPVETCLAWFEEAKRHAIPNPNAMTLATVDADGQPSARTVLLRGFDAHGAVYFTNFQSRKGRAMLAHPRVALLFFWDILNRQIRIEGAITPISDAESDAYFAQRPRESQVNAWASAQSEPIASREALELRQATFLAKFEGVPVPRPPHWGGTRVALECVEIWQGHPYRLHDRVQYTRLNGATIPAAWRVNRLCP